MDLVYMLLIYFCFIFFLFVVNYYVNLFSSKELYTREDVSNFMPYLSESLGKMTQKYNVSGLVVALAVSSLFGVGIPLLSMHWFFNSSILFAVLFLVSPAIKESFDASKVNASDSRVDEIANLFSRYIGIIVLGFGTGTGASLMLNWANKKELGFLWFAVNIIAVIVLEQYVISRELKE